MFLSKMSVSRPVTVTMLLLVFVVFGVLAYFGMSLNLMPSIELPFVTVQTVYPGAGPKEIETLITNKIEDAVSTISNISYIQSYSMDNASFVMMEFDLGKNVDVANQEVKDKVDAIINNLPADAQKPIVGKFDLNAMPVIRMVLSGTQSSLELFEYADKRLKDRLSQISGVAQVDVSGGQNREIQVVLNERTVFANNISLAGLSQILATHNMNLPAGSFKTANQEIAVKVQGDISDLQNLKDIEVPTAFGYKKLSQIADIADVGSEVRERTTFFDLDKRIRQENVVSISILKSSDGNPVKISKNINKQMNSIRNALPEGMELTVVQDQADFVESAVNDTMGNIYLGVLLTGLVLFIFLHDLRSTLIVALAMPISIISTFSLMQIAGFSINIMSLLGLSTSIGVLVANSIVVLENIFRYKDMGHDNKHAAEQGTAEIAVAVLASTLTNVVVFLPIGTMGGILGQIFKEFGLTVTFATFFSLLIAFTLTPMLASLILPEKKESGDRGSRGQESGNRGFVNALKKLPDAFSHIIDSGINYLESIYQKSLKTIMKTKLSSVGVLVFIVFLFVFSVFVASKIGFEFMPNMDQGDIAITVELPIGYSLEETAQTLVQIEAVIAKYPEVLYILTNLGSSGRMNRTPNNASTAIKLVDFADRDYSTQQVVDRMIKDLSYIPNAKITVKAQSSAGPGGSSSAVQLFLIGQEDERLLKLSEEVLNKIRDIPGLVNLDTTTRSGKPEITIEPKRDQLAITGNNVMEIAIGVRAAIEGLVSTQFKEQGSEYDIKITMYEDAYNTPEKLKNLTIITSRGKFQLAQLADVYFSEGVNQIIHRDKAKTISITGDPATGIPLGNVTSEINHRLAEIEFPDGYRSQWAGSAEMMNEAVFEMGKAALLAILLTYMLLAAILESFIQPFMIMATVPMGLVGVFFIQYLSGLTMNIFSMMAIIMLVGIVVNNAILILDFANQLIREQGKSVKDALLEACPVKLKPIIMSNIAIILGMLPMALGIGDAGIEFRQSMGIVSIGGLIMSTLLTLYVIPALYFTTTKQKKV